MKIFERIFVLSLFALLLLSCGKRDDRTVMSEKTGWSYNDPEGGFFNVNTEYQGKIPTGMVYIPVSTSVEGRNSDITSMQDNSQKKRIAASGFFMDEYEVTNLNWREYVTWLKKYFANDPRKALMALPDETVWRSQLAYNEPYVRDYYSHVAYSFYPVVGVTWEQVTTYCKWRTDRLNELQLINMGVLEFKMPEDVSADLEAEPDSAHKYIFMTQNARDYVFDNSGEDADMFDINADGYADKEELTVALNGGLYDAECRLPTEAEWEYAAYGIETIDGEYFENNTYPWQGAQVRKLDDKETMGDFYSNYRRGRGDPIGIAINNTLTVPVNYFFPNGYGLYNMSGNVNEWVMDVYRSTQEEQDDINPFRGNEFESDSSYTESILTKYFADLGPTQRDSLRNAMIKERGITNGGFDYRNFKDGDKRSSLNDSILAYKNATPIEKANMISNTARVYKGGSWKDRALYLNPANRRWLEEKKCANDIGFRCVMSTVGGNEFKRF